MSPIPDTGLLKLLNTGGIFCSNGVTLVGLLDGGWSPERQSPDYMLGIFSPTPHSLETGEKLDVDLMAHSAYVMKLL